eukprot:1183260-Prorocentrum_minimum.AAC.1
MRYAHTSCVRLVHDENMPTRPASDWFMMGICPRALRPIGSSREYTHVPTRPALCVSGLRRAKLEPRAATYFIKVYVVQ